MRPRAAERPLEDQRPSPSIAFRTDEDFGTARTTGTHQQQRPALEKATKTGELALGHHHHRDIPVDARDASKISDRRAEADPRRAPNRNRPRPGRRLLEQLPDRPHLVAWNRHQAAWPADNVVVSRVSSVSGVSTVSSVS
jgi:hypothetical protein